MIRIFTCLVVFSISLSNAFAAVDCDLEFQGKITTYRRLDVGNMFGSVRAKVLQSGKIDSHKLLIGMGCDGSDSTPPVKCSVHLSDASEPVNMGGYSRAKSLGKMEFSALIPAVTTQTFGDREAGEDELSITCTVSK